MLRNYIVPLSVAVALIGCSVLLWLILRSQPTVGAPHTENFLLSPVDAHAEYGVQHRRVMESVTLRCMGPSRDHLYLQHSDGGDVQLVAAAEESATRWHVYKNAAQSNFAIALASDPAYVLQAKNNNVLVELSSGASRFQWQLTATVHSRHTLVVEIQSEQGGRGFLGPSWSQAGSNHQGPLSTGVSTAQSWQRWLVNATTQPTPSCDPPQACHWTTNYPSC